MLFSPKAVLGKLVRLASDGSLFRFYAPQSPAASCGPHLRVAIVSLIPHLGDSVLLFPLLDAIRQEHPDAEISLFSAENANLLSLHPAIDHFYHFKRRTAWSKSFGATYIFDLWNSWRTEYKHLRFDVCVVPRGGVDPSHSSHLAWMLGGKMRAGYSPALEPELSGMDLGGGRLFTSLVTTPNGVHEVVRGAEVLALAGVLRYPIDLKQRIASLQVIAESEPGRHFISQWPQLASPYAIIAPGASFLRRRWTPKKFAELAQTEIIDRKIIPVLVGSPAERPLSESIASRLSKPAMIFSNATVVELSALCLGAQFFIGNDSGPGHIAGALGVPTVEATAFARSGDPRHHASPNRSHPCGPYVKVVQPSTQLPPCTTTCVATTEHCISQITSVEMSSALHALLAAKQIAKQ